MARKKHDVETDALPWEQQPGETAKAYKAFCRYRDMDPGKRSLQRLSEDLGNKSIASVKKWSSDHEWVKRAESWDAEMDRQAREAHLEELTAMRKRHARIAEKMLSKVEEFVENMDPLEMKPGDAGKWAEVASKLERVSLGDSGEVIEERDGGKAINPVTFFMPDNGRDKENG